MSDKQISLFVSKLLKFPRSRCLWNQWFFKNVEKSNSIVNKISSSKKESGNLKPFAKTPNTS